MGAVVIEIDEESRSCIGVCNTCTSDSYEISCPMPVGLFHT